MPKLDTRPAIFTFVLTLALAVVTLALGACAPTAPKPNTNSAAASSPDPAAFTKSMRHLPGFLDLYVDDAQAKVYWQLPAADANGDCGELLYVESLRSGLGSNPVGLDRGQLGAQRVVHLRRVGPRLLLTADNLDFRANTDNEDERLAVQRSFARSILASLEIKAESKAGSKAGTEASSFLVDLTPFLVRDAHHSIATLKQSGQGAFSLDEQRSTFEPAATLVFPDNVELEATLTLRSKQPGALVRGVTPDPTAVTLVQHHSFIRLPDPGYQPRAFDPRSGSFGIGFADYAVDLESDLQVRYLERHRLRHQDPANPTSPAREPIVYYVDRGAPPRIRQALIDGASWWADAFAAAGFPNAFRVELLPEGAHPLDVRYNVIQWVHRRTRGWSYGGSITDPRTGEILKGHVSLGSLRVRQDRLIFEGLLGTAKTGSGDADDPVELALARIRQLAAHEVGHTLGLSHNFAASTYGRASVMDYPAPWLHADERAQDIDTAGAYAVGIGQWDVQAIRYAYTEYADEASQRAGLAAILEENRRQHYAFLTDRDARPAGGAHPLAHLWDNGSDAATELDNVLAVRRVALANFGADRLAPGLPQAELQKVLVPVYLYHRYQTEAAVKLIGGADYDYAVHESDETAPSRLRPVDDATQRRALAAVLRTLDPRELDLPDDLRALLLPAAPGMASSDRELFESSTGPVFDALAAAATATDDVLRLLLHPQRCMRLAEAMRSADDRGALDLDEVLRTLSDQLFDRQPKTERLRPIAQTQQRLYLDRLVALGADPRTPHVVRVSCEAELHRLHERLADRASRNENARVLAGDLQNYFENRVWTEGPRYRPLTLPPGSPIGSATAEDGACVTGW